MTDQTTRLRRLCIAVGAWIIVADQWPAMLAIAVVVLLAWIESE